MRSNKIKPPKILTWIARKKGITDELAVNLWRRAAGEAQEMNGCCDCSDYHGLAVSRFLDLAEDEGFNSAPRAPEDCRAFMPDTRWFMRQQKRFWQLNHLANKRAFGYWLSNVKFLFLGHRLAYQAR